MKERCCDFGISKDKVEFDSKNQFFCPSLGYDLELGWPDVLEF